MPQALSRLLLASSCAIPPIPIGGMFSFSFYVENSNLALPISF